MSAVSPTLDQILFEIDYPDRARHLEDLLRRGRAIPLTAVGGEVRFHWHGEEWVFTPGEVEFVPPRLAIHFLELYGKQGRYHGQDQATGYSPTSLESLAAHNEEMAARLAPKMRYLEGYLTHDPAAEQSRRKARAKPNEPAQE